MKNWKLLLWSGIFLILAAAALDAAWWDDTRDIRAPWEPLSYVLTVAFGVLFVGGIVAIVVALRHRSRLKKAKNPQTSLAEQ